MAVKYDARRNRYYVQFRWPRGRDGSRRTFAVESEREAKSRSAAVDNLLSRLSDPNLPFSIPPDVEDQPLWIFSGGAKGRKETASGDRPAKLQDLIDAYLSQRQAQTECHEISAATFMDDKYQVEKFAAYAKSHGMGKITSALDPDFLLGFKSTIPNAKSRWHAAQSVKRLITWAWKSNRLETLPRILDDFGKVSLPAPRPKFFNVPELEALYTQASPSMQLYLLLGLNCGFTQIDIATLTEDMLDWKTGILDRDRHKTGIRQGAKLWPVTLQTLQDCAQRGREDGLLFVSTEGNPLVWGSVGSDGSPTRVDSIQRAFSRLRKKDGVKIRKGLSFKSLRKTGADMLAKQFQKTPHIVDLYLAHSTGMRRHYAQQHFDELHTATDWLGTQFDFNADDPKSSGKK